jgi:hypothetical protein
MRTLETDYLVVGAGAMGMAFTDALIDHADVHRDAADVGAPQLHLAGVDADPEREVKTPYRLSDRQCSANGACRAVEGRQHAVTHRLHGLTTEPLDLSAHDGLVTVEQLSPACIAQPARLRGGPDDVGEHHGLDGSQRVAFTANSGDELLDLVDDVGCVLLPDVVVGPGELDQLGVGDLACDVARSLHTQPGLVRAVEHQRGDLHQRQEMAHVDERGCFDQRPHQ